MKATITLKDLDLLSGALLRLGERELPISLAFQVTRLMHVFEADIQAYQLSHAQLVNRYAVVKHNQRIIETHDVPLFNRDLVELQQTEITVAFDPISFDDLVDTGIAITAVDLKTLGFLFFHGEQEDAPANE